MENGGQGDDGMSIEMIYQKKSQLEHILLRPDTYIGSVERVQENMWVYDANKGMVQRQISYVPGLYKIFDEILVNAADNKQRDSSMNTIKIDISPEKNTISVWNNGKGIPVTMHKEEKMYVPTMIFGHLLTSSNYNDDEKKVTGGRNGYGAKLCNIFSTSFIVETATKEFKKGFKQTWSNNMGNAGDPKISSFSGSDFTKITFTPDLEKFKMEELDADIVALMSRRAYDVAASTRGVSVFLNGEKLPIKTFKDYIDLYIKNDEDSDEIKVAYEQSGRWEVACCQSGGVFQQVSFVNSIATTKGGRHVDHVVDNIIKTMIESIKKKNKAGINIKPFQVRNHIWIFVNCLIENPTFDSQTKENMTLQVKNFGSKCTLSDKFFTQIAKTGIVDAVLSWAKYKAEIDIAKTSGKKSSKLLMAKLEDANFAGKKESMLCTLILTEGDSAKSLVMSGFSVIGRDYFGVFPLRGKLLNVREATFKQKTENHEIIALCQILGLQYKKKYNTIEDQKTLRYGKVMIMTDQDQDGSHIKGLLINFIHTNWPDLLKLDFLEEFITPIVKATKGREKLSFYSMPEFEEWKTDTPNHKAYDVKYYKGLGTSDSAEAKEYFEDMDRHRIVFKYNGSVDDDNILMAFSKKHVENRKEWLTAHMDEVKRRKLLGLPERYLYAKGTKQISYTDFVNLELVLFSNADNVRSIPCMVDGLKPGQRKVMYTCFKRNDKKEVKVAQLSGSVAEKSAYHHGEVSLQMTIVNLAQNYIGSNNINLLEPRGQFGTRLMGGKDCASARYIFTKMSPLTRLIFHPHDDPLLAYEYDDGTKIEPQFYIPIIPMLLVNGADGIGTGWATKIYNHNPREIIQNIRRMLVNEEPKEMHPWYKNFQGSIEFVSDGRYICCGNVQIVQDDKIEISELPVGIWTSVYKENVLLPITLNGTRDDSEKKGKDKDSGKKGKDADKKGKGKDKDDSEKKPKEKRKILSDIREYHTDTTVRFVLFFLPGEFERLREEEGGFYRVLKLTTSLSTNQMHCFDHLNVLRRFPSALDILREFFPLRLEYYAKRKEYLIGQMAAQADRLSHQARFIVEKCDGTITVENKKRKAMIDELIKRGYPPDPVLEWQRRAKIDIDEKEDEEADDDVASAISTKKEKGNADKDSTDVKNFDYLLGMAMWVLTEERKRQLIEQRDSKHAEIANLKGRSIQSIWSNDLEVLERKMDELEGEERRKEFENLNKFKSKSGSLKGAKAAPKKRGVKVEKGSTEANENLPDPRGFKVEFKVTDDIIKKVSTAVALANKPKSSGEKVGRKKKDDSIKEEVDEFDTLVEGGAKGPAGALTDSIKIKKEPKKRAVKPKKEAGDGLKQPKLDFGKVKPRKKRSNSFSDKDDSDVVSGSEVELNVTPRERPGRRATAQKVNYSKLLADSDESSNIEMTTARAEQVEVSSEDGSGSDNDDAESDAHSSPKKKTVAKRPRKHQSSSDSEENKKMKKKRVVSSDSDSDYDG